MLYWCQNWGFLVNTEPCCAQTVASRGDTVCSMLRSSFVIFPRPRPGAWLGHPQVTGAVSAINSVSKTRGGMPVPAIWWGGDNGTQHGSSCFCSNLEPQIKARTTLMSSLRTLKVFFGFVLQTRSVYCLFAVLSSGYGLPLQKTSPTPPLTPSSYRNYGELYPLSASPPMAVLC